jgi:asparagine synthase (glutamine-hydrolysing)
MCGVLACFGSSIDIDWVKQTLHQLENRGPDAKSFVNLSKNMVFGATRLAMTDPHPRSNQPMQNKFGALCFNGEIYNHEEIRENLDYVFNTFSDTETVLVSANSLGLAGCAYMNGMFAIVYYDFKNNRLELTRDKLGKKPLYYRFNGSSVYVCSLLQPLTTVDSVSLDLESIIQFLSLGFIIDPRTPYNEIKAIEPGEIRRFNLQIHPVTSALETKDKLGEPPISSKKVNQSQLRKMLEECVTKRIEGHDKTSVSLSGGVDSTLVALILKDLKIETKCFSVYWPNPDKSRYNKDATAASRISEKLGHEFEMVEAIHPEEIPIKIDEYLEVMQEPNNNSTGLSMMSLYQAISQDQYRLNLTGDGADEIFFGYERYRKVNVNNSLQSLTAKFINTIMRYENQNLRSLFQKRNQFVNLFWLHWHSTFSTNEMRSLFNLDVEMIAKFESDLANRINLKVRQNRSAIQESSLTSSLMDLDSELWLTMESNRRLDRISMHYSVEARSPFQDFELILAGRELRTQVRLKELIGKQALFDSFPELKQLPILGEKSGFVSPLGQWIRTNQAYIQEQITFLHEVGLLKKPLAVEKYAHSGQFKLLREIWTLAILSRWFQKQKQFFSTNFNLT